MSIRFSRMTGPQWVCEAVSMSSARLMPKLFSTSVATSTETWRGMPMRSVVTSTSRLPVASSRQTAFAYRSCSLPSDGLVREAYPAIHIGCSGVMTFVATPALNVRIGGELD